jgi:hypothetical protein
MDMEDIGLIRQILDESLRYEKALRVQLSRPAEVRADNGGMINVILHDDDGKVEVWTTPALQQQGDPFTPNALFGGRSVGTENSYTAATIRLLRYAIELDNRGSRF